ncbi:MAG TPA: glycosyltransferase family 2 protein [Phycisphaerae bacterium]|nr:glycosyltransferase family 2 protein [Phycisphaerae bacterium]HPU25686.1 glycosyltransferase family 2 protein [Phycisphaerae bacterium]
MIIWTILLFLVALVWCTRHLDIQRAKREQIPLSSQTYPGPPEDAPFVSFLIAGKDEEANIERAVRSVLKQDYPNFELIVINDRSQDRTPAILERLKAEDTTGRLRVIHVSELREGWFGKNNAMREGVERARGSWLCFGDADCNHTSERSLSMAVRHAIENKADFFSLLPRLETHSLWERIIQPVAGALMVFWFHPQRVNDPNRPEAYANGAFMLMTRKCYEMIGGHEPVKTEVNEDVHMARICKEKGQKLFVCQNADLYTVHMYSGFGQIWRGWSRIFYGCFGTFRRLRVTMLMLLGTNIFPYTSLAIAAAVFAFTNWFDANPNWYWVGGAAAFAVSMQLSVIARYYKLSYTNPWLAPTFIVGAVICIGMLINAMLKLNGRTTVTWRGTTYRGDTVQPSAEPVAGRAVEARS